MHNDFQSGYESCFTALAPFQMTEAGTVWCYPGHMAAYAGGSFHKMIWDEEILVNCNRILQGLDLSIDPLLNEKLAKAMDSKSFLTIGDVSIYRKEQRVTPLFDKKGFDQSGTAAPDIINGNAETEIQRRLDRYQLPERTESQKRLLNKYLPPQCKY